MKGGIFPAIVGTLYLVLGSILVSLPLGVFSAVYLVEYAPAHPVVRAIRSAIHCLAGVPSVVFGLFGRFGVRQALWLWCVHCFRLAHPWHYVASRGDCFL